MGRKCGVEGCLSDSGRQEDVGVTFHKIPSHNDIRPKWMSLCRIPDDKKTMKVIYICSRHFLRKDFCNFRGTKYMLKQGVLPSVFPWDKSTLERIKNVKREPVSQTEPMEVETAAPASVEPVETKPELPAIKTECEVTEEENPPEIKKELPEQPAQEVAGRPNFGVSSYIEVMDNNHVWYPAQIMEEDYAGNEILIHYDSLANKHDEWINKDSPRLRLAASETEPKLAATDYAVGERILASWSDARKFPATITKILPNDTYEVLFDDGFVKALKAHRMCKTAGRPMQASPLFDPVKGSKQERRDKKRKINVAALFGKRPKMDQSPTVRSRSRPKSKSKSSSHRARTVEVKQEPLEEEPLDVFETWVPQWVDGYPVGVESQIETSEGNRKSVIVADPRIPKGWTKHLAQRMHGASAGKWDTVIISSDNKRFRSKSEIKHYLEETGLMKYNPTQFDFSLHRQRFKKSEETARRSLPVKEEVPMQQTELIPVVKEEIEKTEQLPEEEALLENKNCLLIPMVDDGFKCPIDGCGKTYRRENLAQMHVKHYHPEYTKFLDSTPNVADLAYARTVGESLSERSPSGVKSSVSKASPKTIIPRSSTTLKPAENPAATQSAATAAVTEPKPQSPLPQKDSEIIKLLNTKSDYDIKPLPSGLPSSMYPEINLKDLLTKSEAIPPYDEMSLRALSSTRPTGIKTILPVIRSDGIKTNLKRNKKGYLEQLDSPKVNHTTLTTDHNCLQQLLTTTQSPYHNHSQLSGASHREPLGASDLLHYQSNNVIIEGGKVIKIVRMKQEEIINCTCGYPEEDGLMIQCDLCLCWQHAFCNNIVSESQVPEKYICYICQHPVKQRVSQKYYHDQDWLKYGTLPVASFHTKDDEVLQKRFETLKKSHDMTGHFYELRDFANSLKVKLKIAEAKNHPKLYLWSKPWTKSPPPEQIKEEEKDEPEEEIDSKPLLDDIKTEESPMLLSILKGNSKAPKIPEPEAAIDSADCRLNLLEHINQSQTLIEERLDEFEKEIDGLEDASFYEVDENYPKTRQTLNMLLRDLATLQELSQLTTL